MLGRWWSASLRAAREQTSTHMPNAQCASPARRHDAQNTQVALVAEAMTSPLGSRVGRVGQRRRGGDKPQLPKGRDSIHGPEHVTCSTTRVRLRRLFEQRAPRARAGSVEGHTAL